MKHSMGLRKEKKKEKVSKTTEKFHKLTSIWRHQLQTEEEEEEREIAHTLVDGVCVNVPLSLCSTMSLVHRVHSTMSLTPHPKPNP